MSKDNPTRAEMGAGDLATLIRIGANCTEHYIDVVTARCVNHILAAAKEAVIEAIAEEPGLPEHEDWYGWRDMYDVCSEEREYAEERLKLCLAERDKMWAVVEAARKSLPPGIDDFTHPLLQQLQDALDALDAANG